MRFIVLVLSVNIVNCGSFQPKSLVDMCLRPATQKIIRDLERANNNVLDLDSTEAQEYIDGLKILPADIIRKLSIAALGQLSPKELCRVITLDNKALVCDDLFRDLYSKSISAYDIKIKNDKIISALKAHTIYDGCMSNDHKYFIFRGNCDKGYVIDLMSGDYIFTYDACKAVMINGHDCFFMNFKTVEKYNIDSRIRNTVYEQAKTSFFRDKIISVGDGIGIIERSFHYYTNNNSLIIVDKDGSAKAFHVAVDDDLFISDKKNLIALVANGVLSVYKLTQDLLQPVATIVPNKSIASITFSPCSNYVAYGTDKTDGNVYIVDIKSKQTIAVITVCKKNTFPIVRLSWANDNASLIVEDGLRKIFTIDLKLYKKMLALMVK
ncbi:MAG: WD40 repeat domain-containing protein [Candidatus Babeliaceae bacterium]